MTKGSLNFSQLSLDKEIVFLPILVYSRNVSSNKESVNFVIIVCEKYMEYYRHQGPVVQN